MSFLVDKEKYNDIDPVDQRILAAAFNELGYVLDFSNSGFDQFTISSVGVPIKATYNQSKARSLAEFTAKGETPKVIKLYRDLISYYETKWPEEVQTKAPRALRILALKAILDKYSENGSCLQSPAIDKVSHLYIKKLADRAQKDIDNGEFDSALTKAKTLLEEVFCYVLECKGSAKNKNGDVFVLYNQVKSLLGMKQNAGYDKRVNGLLSGLEKILQSVSEMRNAQSDAHGVGRSRINIKSYHARLFVNAAQTMADFVLSVAGESEVR